MTFSFPSWVLRYCGESDFVSKLSAKEVLNWFCYEVVNHSIASSVPWQEPILSFVKMSLGVKVTELDFETFNLVFERLFWNSASVMTQYNTLSLPPSYVNPGLPEFYNRDEFLPGNKIAGFPLLRSICVDNYTTTCSVQNCESNYDNLIGCILVHGPQNWEQ